MNKKGFFFSLSAILVVVVIALYLSYSETSRSTQDFIEVQYVKHSQVINYIELLRDDYVPSFIKTSAKLSLHNMSYEVDKTGSPYSNIKSELENAINTGMTNPAVPNTRVTYKTIPYYINMTEEIMPVDFSFEELQFTIRSVEQVRPKVIRINSTATISLNSTENGSIFSHIEWEDKINYSQNISTIGFVNPEEGKVIKTYWVENNTQGCFLNATAGESCIFNGVQINGTSPP